MPWITRKIVYLTKHRQIIEALTTEIQEGRLKPYDRLPSEKELCEQWQTSRSTVRKAMDQLTDRGKIFRVPGKGSFVSFPKISHDTSQILSFTEKMKAQGLDVVTKLIQKELIEPNEEIAAALKLARKDRVLKIQRLRIVKGEPLALQTAFMPSNICGNLMKEDLETKSLNYLIREQCQHPVVAERHLDRGADYLPKGKAAAGEPPRPHFFGGRRFDVRSARQTGAIQSRGFSRGPGTAEDQRLERL